MNKELWDKISDFKFDDPAENYGFSIRLANENFWTKAFTKLAIIEYKKFMYLAATTGLMVSPSEIVDTVWHQHLIFTQSYQEFCSLLGRQIQHIPSTHNKDKFEKFRLARERTQKLYSEIFGAQPKEIWEYSSMYESLHLEKSKINIRTFLIVGILSFMVCTIPAYFLLRPIYVQIQNPYFILWFVVLCILVFGGMEMYNQQKLNDIVRSFDDNAFIFQLHPYELIYLKTGKIENVIDSTVNELLVNQAIVAYSNTSIKMRNTVDTNSTEELQTLAIINKVEQIYYPDLVNRLANKPIFQNTVSCMQAF